MLTISYMYYIHMETSPYRWRMQNKSEKRLWALIHAVRKRWLHGEGGGWTSLRWDRQTRGPVYIASGLFIAIVTCAQSCIYWARSLKNNDDVCKRKLSKRRIRYHKLLTNQNRYFLWRVHLTLDWPTTPLTLGGSIIYTWGVCIWPQTDPRPRPRTSLIVQ